ncbi:CRISPR-associated helicase/endonuclease Cas3 [Desulfonema ishimotonii]|uniref:CRISPR-associated helicase/endonuclease Cas3 n=1 Tax=Desulfonema ishimotonii TaxID=45657 RepID=A0A401FUK6_9BACT|nr:CRISPR-associated helicase Cas3' [Desulfonema ishimotonii]GBC60651.1 CRISPR-associated helicase/endonuclease Cas3 [Desulfonema ishimotonii]
MEDFDFKTVWAKSDGKSLLQHLEDCLCIYRDLTHALPLLPILAKSENFFDWLFCAVYMHDWGKAHIEFQKVLGNCKTLHIADSDQGKAHMEFQKVLRKVKNDWHRNRHEFFSVPFVGMLPFSPDENQLITQAITGHHKDFEALSGYLPSKQKIENYGITASGVNPLDFQENLLKKLNIGYLKALKEKFQTIYGQYAAGNRQFEFQGIDFANQPHPVRAHVRPYLDDGTQPDHKEYWQQMLLIGGLKICDHMGSAEIPGIPRLSETHFGFLKQSDYEWYPHQEVCGQTGGNLFLTAPTGSGKTEAALLWARKQFEAGHQGRIFYVLPYTASINAMHRRLVRDFDGDVSPDQSRHVGILHGKLGQYLSAYFENADDPVEKEGHIQKIKEMHRQVVHPLKVVTPFQILKYFFGVKGFEKGLTELAGAMLIFDEIHAYDMQTFAQISASLEWMRKYMGIRVMVMTATLPAFMLEELRRAVGDSETVRADKALLEKFRRHRAGIVEGNIFHQIPSIRNALEDGKRVIVVCNTVANAQAVYQKLADATEENAVLLHSRFTVEDRLAKEKALFEETDTISLLVGTQAIEVSLDIDFDVMFTEPAPLDALIQRFGRINRRREKGICPVYVCREGGENDGYIYPGELVERTLAVLADVSEIDETLLQTMLDRVYPDWPDKKKYDDVRAAFSDSLTRLRPFMRHKESEAEFYKRFNGVPVMPGKFQELYEKRLRAYELIEAEKLFVSLHQGTFSKLRNNGICKKDAAVVEKKGRLKSVPYWLAQCPYDRNLGLLDNDTEDIEIKKDEDSGGSQTAFF